MASPAHFRSLCAGESSATIAIHQQMEPGGNKKTVSQKKQDTKLLPITSPNVNRFLKLFHW